MQDLDPPVLPRDEPWKGDLDLRFWDVADLYREIESKLLDIRHTKDIQGLRQIERGLNAPGMWPEEPAQLAAHNSLVIWLTACRKLKEGHSEYARLLDDDFGYQHELINQSLRWMFVLDTVMTME